MPESGLSISIIIPCFNEEDAIEKTIAEIGQLSLLPNSYELIVVDDGSNDGSLDILENLSQNTPWLKVIRHDINRGYGAALKTGIRRAEGEFIVITDADGTYPNNGIPDLIGEMTDTDMVVGSRTGEEVEYSKIRKIPKIILTWYCSWITDRAIPDINSGLRVFRKSIVEKYLHILPNTFSFTTSITMAFMTNDYAVKYVPINYFHRIGKSKIKPIRDPLRFILLILRTGMYFAPLRTSAPIIATLTALFLASVAYDIHHGLNLTDKTLVLLMLTVNSALFALLADVMDKKSRR